MQNAHGNEQLQNNNQESFITVKIVPADKRTYTYIHQNIVNREKYNVTCMSMHNFNRQLCAPLLNVDF
jgi:hypothetical protein